MSGQLVLETVEVHAEGEPSRVVTSAAELVQGATMAERFAYCQERLDWLRHLLLREPRGHPALCGVLLLPAVNPESHFGMIVLEHGGFTPMSGSNTICAVTAAIQTGLVPVPDGARTVEVVIDTAVGTVRTTARLDGTRVQSVTVANVPSFVVALDHPLEVPEIGSIEVDVVFGGQFFVQTDVRNVGLDLDPGRAKDLARAGALIKLAAREQIRVSHPVNPGVGGVALVMLHSGAPVPGQVSRNTVVMSNGPLLPNDPGTWTGALDRSPCGTGTCARMAALHRRGDLALGEDFHHRSIVDTEFVGRLVGETRIGDHPAVLPTITGRGWVTGRAQWILDPSDPFPTGFTLADIWAPQ
ncbi:MAG: proline racemase family protein [Actinomycetales bacterium]